MRQILIWSLRTRTVPSMLRVCYSTMEIDKLKLMLGFPKAAKTPEVMQWLRGDELAR